MFDYLLLCLIHIKEGTEDDLIELIETHFLR
ncbi:unnamed protein product, partial [marine sediment metagenome]